MRVFRDLDDIGNIKNPVVTTGSFDGVHVGHKAIINRLRKLAEQINGETVLITFLTRAGFYILILKGKP